MTIDKHPTIELTAEMNLKPLIAEVKEVAQALNEFADEIICPYCGKKYGPTYEETYIGGEDVDCYKEGEQGEFTCDECGKKFRLSAEMKWEYTTETIDGEMTEEEHDDMDNFLG